MKVKAENYKGIDFVRISQLPEAQKELIAATLPSDQIIKILKENELLSDCVQYKHYVTWFNGQFEKKAQSEKVEVPSTSSINLALD